MKINLIAAMCKNRGIGFKNKLPWNIKTDLKYFYNQTTNICDMTVRENGRYANAVFMGINTFMSIQKPLKYRDNFIITSKVVKNNPIQLQHYCFVNNINECIDICYKNNYHTSWCIGGSQIYNTAIKEVDFHEIHLTTIDKAFVCDTFFPEIPSKYHLYNKTTISHKDHNTDIKYDIHFNVFKMKKIDNKHLI